MDAVSPIANIIAYFRVAVPTAAPGRVADAEGYVFMNFILPFLVAFAYGAKYTTFSTQPKP
jgi:hypothetical protein